MHIFRKKLSPKMNFGTKMALGFSVIIIVVGSITAAVVHRMIKSALVSSINNEHMLMAQQAMLSIDRIIYRRLERLQSLISTHPEILDQLVQSNADFANMGDPVGIINERDVEWKNFTKEKDSPLMNQILNNPSAVVLSNFDKFYYQEYGFSVFPEIFLTNKYGAIVASSNRTSDYNQADEDWWKNTKQDSIYISDIQFDDSVGMSVIDICISIKDKNGNFLGILKAVLNIKDSTTLVSELDQTIDESGSDVSDIEESAETYLISKNGQLIYASDPESAASFSQFSPRILKQINFQTDDSFVTTEDHEGAGDVLYTYAHSQGYKSYRGNGWIFLFEHPVKAIYEPVFVLDRILLLIILCVFLLTLFISYYLSRFISKPIRDLRHGMEMVAGGDLSHRININSQDEIGELTDIFNGLTANLEKTRESIQRTVEGQTNDISKKAEDLSKQKIAILNILEDVDEEKKKSEILAKDLEKFKLAVDNASDHILITDQDGKIIYANQAVEEITGFSIKEIIGQKAGNSQLWGGQMPKDFYVKMWQTIKIDKKIFSGLIQNKRKDGRKYQALSSISPVLNDQGEVQFFVGIERDVTKEKEIDQAKTEFVSLASHQLRTPLSAINWYAEMLLNGDAGKLNSEQLSYVKEIFDGNQRMVDLVNALLNVSRIELGTLAIDSVPTDLRELAQSVINELQPQIGTRKQLVVTNFDKKLPLINLDPKIMRIVWQNFLSNAVKYTPDKGKITVGVVVKGKDALISVADTGYGIPKYQQSKIFTKLFRADNIREKVTDGTGLGLYIVKSIIKQFGGQLWFESVENKGTTFYATIPLKGVAKKEGSKGLNYNK